jgi:hypothetical protein
MLDFFAFQTVGSEVIFCYCFCPFFYGDEQRLIYMRRVCIGKLEEQNVVGVLKREHLQLSSSV